MKVGKRWISALLIIVSVAIISRLVSDSSKEAPMPAVEFGYQWNDRPDNVLLLAGLLEERHADYQFDSGIFRVKADEKLKLKETLADPRVREFWQSKHSSEDRFSELVLSEAQRLKKKAENVLDKAFGEESVKLVLVKLDCTSGIEVKRESFQSTPNVVSDDAQEKEDWPLCHPLEAGNYPVSSPQFRVELLRVLVLMNEPDNEDTARIIRGLVAQTTGYDEARGDEIQMITFPASERSTRVYDWVLKARRSALD